MGLALAALGGQSLLARGTTLSGILVSVGAVSICLGASYGLVRERAQGSGGERTGDSDLGAFVWLAVVGAGLTTVGALFPLLQ